MSSVIFSNFPSIAPSRRGYLFPGASDSPKRHVAEEDTGLCSPVQNTSGHFLQANSHPSGFSLPHFSERKDKDIQLTWVFILSLLKVFQKEKVLMMRSHQGQISTSEIVDSLTL